MSDERKAKLNEALDKLDHKTDTDWTQSGLPSVDRVKELSGFSDVTRTEIGDTRSDFVRTKPADKPADDDGKSEGTGEGAELSELEKAEQRIKPNMPADENENVGRSDLGPYDGQAHTSDQRENLQAQLGTEGSEQYPTAQEIADHIKDPVLLLEAAVAAMNGSDRYRKNGELQTYLRDYSIRQTNIKAHQGRLDKRWADAEKQAG